jgi:hypothetical protein
MSRAPITFDYGKLPNGWPQPTFMSISEDGSLNIEWCFGTQGADDSWRVTFIWDPDLRSAQVIRTDRKDQESLCTDDGDDPFAITASLERWLRTDSAKDKGTKR